MIDLICISDISEINYWADVFRVLGIKGCQPVLHKVGIPAAMAACPEGSREAALHFWHHNWDGIRFNGVRVGTGYADPGFPENYRLGIQSLLKDTFAIILKYYEADGASSLYQWTQRFFIDQDQVNLWFTWSFLLSAWSESVSSGSAPDVGSLIRDTIHTEFGTTAEQDDAASLGNIKRIPLSTVEQRMIALEVTQPNDFREVDLLGLLERVIRFQHAYQAWVKIDKNLSASEREALLWWGYEQAAALGIPAEHVRLPVLP